MTALREALRTQAARQPAPVALTSSCPFRSVARRQRQSLLLELLRRLLQCFPVASRLWNQDHPELVWQPQTLPDWQS